MADKWPLANGNWSNAANWNGGTKPTAGDDVFADGKTVTIDEDITVASIRTTQRSGGTAGGGFSVGAARTINCDLISGTTTVLTSTATTGTLTIVGNVDARNGANALRVNSAALSITGNVYASNTNAFGYGIHLDSAAIPTLQITGDVYSGSATNAFVVFANAGVFNTVVTITGDVFGGSNGSGYVFWQSTFANVTVNGNITSGAAGMGAVSNLVLNGDAIAGTAPALPVAGTPIVYLNGNLICGVNGHHPVGAATRVLIDSTLQMQHEYRVNNAGVAGFARSLYTGGVNLGQPVPADVRFGTQFGASNEYTGTLRVPDPQYVSIGVLTDDTVGTLAVDLQPILDAIANITVDNAAIAGAVRTELATELGRIDATVSSRLAAASYVAPSNDDVAAIKAKTDQLTFSTPNKVDSSGTTPAEVWSYFVAATGYEALGKITKGVQDSVNVVVPLNALPFKVQRNASSKLSLRRFVNFTHTINDVGSLNGANRLVFTIKESKDTEADDKSFVQVSATIPANSQTDGVLYANALPAGDSRTGGSVVVEDYTENNVAKKRVVVTIKDYVTALIPVAAEATFDLQYFTASGSFILDEGKISIENATTRSTTSA